MGRLRKAMGGWMWLLLLTAVVVGVGLFHTSGQRSIADPPPELLVDPTMYPHVTPPSLGMLSPLPPLRDNELVEPPEVQGAKILLGRYTDPAGYYLFDLATGQEVRLEPFPPDQGAGAPGATMRVSPTGERILYALFNNMEPLDPTGIGSVWTMNPDGSDKRKLAGSDELSYPANAIWSPDGRQIAFLRFPDPLAVYEGKVDAESVELWVMNSDGSEQRKAAQLPPTQSVYGMASAMQWLLDDHVYIVTQITSSGEWLRVNPRTSEVTCLLEGIDPWDVVISPDTRWIVGGGVMSEAKIAALGRRPLYLPADLTWDLKGERAAFLQFPYPYDQSDRPEGIWVHDLRSGQETLVAKISALDVFRSALSPDGSMFLYETIEGLHVVWVDTGLDRLVVPNPPEDQYGIRNGVGFMAWVPVVSQSEHPRSDEADEVRDE